MTIAGKTILVTGANRGIGKALVKEALRRGAQRVYAGTRQPLDQPDDRVTPLILDVTSAAQIQAAAGRVESLDILINNAGVGLYDDLTDRAALEQHLAVNLFGTYGMTQAFLPLLTRSRGAIVNVLSRRGRCRLADRPGLLDLQGGRVLPDPIAPRSAGRTGRAGSCGDSWPRGYRHVARPRRAQGIAGVRRARHLRRGRERGGGRLPRSRVTDAGRELAQRRGQGARTPARRARGCRARQGISNVTAGHATAA